MATHGGALFGARDSRQRVWQRASIAAEITRRTPDRLRVVKLRRSVASEV